MIRCLNCQRTFADHESYSRHKWTQHAGEPDFGDSGPDPTRLDGLVEDGPEPPTLS